MSTIKTASIFIGMFAAFSNALPNSQSTGIIKCPITMDGRVPPNMQLSTFDTAASPFSANFSKGQNLTWSQIIKLPDVDPSRFDVDDNDKPIEVTIDDRSIFVPGGGTQQLGFRRAGLLMGNGSDATNIGVKTFHWSVRQDEKAKLNLTHEYMNVWHEANDYQSNQFSFNTGVMLSQDAPTDSNVTTTGLDKNLWKILDRKNNVIWTTKISRNDWQNFAVTVDYNNNTLQVYYSLGYRKLEAVTQPVSNNNTGGGQFQIGILKKPTETVSVVYDGYEEPNIHEGQIYGSIFIEDSSGGCIST